MKGHFNCKMRPGTKNGIFGIIDDTISYPKWLLFPPSPKWEQFATTKSEQQIGKKSGSGWLAASEPAFFEKNQ